MKMDQIQQLPLDRIVAKKQVREGFDEESLDGLAVSIRTVGQLQPIRVRPSEGRYVIVDGERRFRAVRKLGMTEIAGIVEEKDLTEGEVLQKQLVSNCQREDLTAMEKAMSISRLMVATGWNASKVAAELGMSNPTVTRLLALLSLPESIQRQVAAGEIAPSAAYELVQIADVGQQTELAHRLASGGLNRDGLVGLIKGAQRPSPGKLPNRSCRATASLGAGRSVTVAGASDLATFIASLEEILALARKERPRGVSLKTFLDMCRDQKTAEVVG